MTFSRSADTFSTVALRIADPELFGVTGVLVHAHASASRTPPARSPLPLTYKRRRRAARGLRRPRRHAPGCASRGWPPGPPIASRSRRPAASRRARDRFFPGSVTTLPAPRAAQVGSFATMNDLHFGEPGFGGVLTETGDTLDQPGVPMVRATDTEIPYWRFMNEDAISEINEQWRRARRDQGRHRGRRTRATSSRRPRAPSPASGCRTTPSSAITTTTACSRASRWTATHCSDSRARRAASSSAAGAWCCSRRRTRGSTMACSPTTAWAGSLSALEETRERRDPHAAADAPSSGPARARRQLPEHDRDQPAPLAAALRADRATPPGEGRADRPHAPQPRAPLSRLSGATPFIEVNCTKDYPGGWAHYRLFEDGSFRQEVRRTGSARALEHSTRCRDLFGGGYRHFALGALETRSFVGGRSAAA